MTRLIRNLFISVFACFGLGSCGLILCAIDTNITRQPRFAHVVGREIHTRKKLNLFQPDNSVSDKMRRFYSLSEDKVYGRQTLIAEVPAGHPVRFDKVMRRHGMEDTWDDMFGEITLNGKTYPLALSLGGSVYPDEWRRTLADYFGTKE